MPQVKLYRYLLYIHMYLYNNDSIRTTATSAPLKCYAMLMQLQRAQKEMYCLGEKSFPMTGNGTRKDRNCCRNC